jgi:hypothetical protein
MSQGLRFMIAALHVDHPRHGLQSAERDPNDRKPPSFIDGLDGGVIDILDALGIWDVQHLATSEPGELTIRTLNRIIDWIDQAILISYLHRNIADARLFGIIGVDSGPQTRGW